MAIEVKFAGTDDYGTAVKMLVVGEPGAGKTRTTSCWPDPFILNADAGLMSVADRKTPNTTITDSKQIKEIIDILQGGPAYIKDQLGVPVKTVVIDTLDEVARMLVRERLKSERKEAMAIQDWGWLGDQLRIMVRAFRNLDLHVIFNVHAKSQEDSETGRTFIKPGIQGAMGDEIAGYVDIAVLLQARPVVKVVKGENVREISRFMQTYPDAMHGWIKDRSGRLPQEFTINFNDDFQRMDAIMFGHIRKAQAEEREATVAELKEIVDKSVVEPKLAAKPEPEPESEPVAEVKVEVDTSPKPVEPAPEPLIPTGAVQGTFDKSPDAVAADCPHGLGCTVDKDMADLSFIRFRKRLCRDCFATAKKEKR